MLKHISLIGPSAFSLLNSGIVGTALVPSFLFAATHMDWRSLPFFVKMADFLPSESGV
jgi:hypothetical protein